MNLLYKYCVSENTARDHCDTWYTTLEDATKAFEHKLTQYQIQISNTYKLTILQGNEKIIRHCILTHPTHGNMYIELTLQKV